MKGPLLAVIHKLKAEKRYEIRRGKDGVVYCNCWGWIRNKRCKHLTMYETGRILSGYTIQLLAEGEPEPLTKAVEQAIEMIGRR